MPNQVTPKGFDEFQRKLKALPPQLKKQAGALVYDAAQLWEEKAKLDVPVDQGRLRSLITAKKVSEMTSETVSAADYSAYIEWGTKSRVRVPADIAAYASEFRDTGKAGGRFELQKALYAWMDRVGIPDDKQWFIYISIVTKGIHPHPYFFIQRPFVQKQLFTDLEHMLNTLGK